MLLSLLIPLLLGSLPVDVTFEDIYVLPPLEVCRANRDFARDHLHWICSQTGTNAAMFYREHRWWSEWEEEQRWRLLVWDNAYDAVNEYWYVQTRIDALRSLRKRIGFVAYYTGDLPKPVSEWRFRER